MLKIKPWRREEMCVCVCVFSKEQNCKFRWGAQGRPRWSDILAKSGKVWRKSHGDLEEEHLRRETSAPSWGRALPGEPQKYSSRSVSAAGQGLETKAAKGWAARAPGGHCEYLDFINTVLSCTSWGYCLFHQHGGEKKGGGGEGGKEEGRKEGREKKGPQIQPSSLEPPSLGQLEHLL